MGGGEVERGPREEKAIGGFKREIGKTYGLRASQKKTLPDLSLPVTK